MTEKARRRRDIVYIVEQIIMLGIMFGGFAAVLLMFRWLLQIGGCA